MSLLHLTVAICTHNRVDLLMKAINSIYLAVTPNDCKITVLVIANACTDDTVSKLEHHKTTYLTENTITFDYQLEPMPGKSYALNRALSLINDGYICFVDDDQIIDINYFIAITKAILAYPDASILCGPLKPNWQGDEPNWIHTEGQYRIYPFPIPVFDLGNYPTQLTVENELPPGGQVVIRRDIFDDVGVFSTCLGPIGHNLVGSEDTDFFIRAINKGHIIQYIPSIIQYHYVDKNRLTLKYLLIKSYQRNKSITLSINPDRKPIPLYLFRQLSSNIFHTIIAFNADKYRFHLMRLFSILGEIIGLLAKQ